jgi:hypothetical protein
MTIPKNITYATVYEFALEVFQYDKDKLNAWWITRHEELNGKSPYEVIRDGKGQWLMKHLQRCLL